MEQKMKKELEMSNEMLAEAEALAAPISSQETKSDLSSGVEKNSGGVFLHFGNGRLGVSSGQTMKSEKYYQSVCIEPMLANIPNKKIGEKILPSEVGSEKYILSFGSIEAVDMLIEHLYVVKNKLRLQINAEGVVQNEQAI